MPRGWYLAQGLIPLGESSSDDDEGPCELPDGRLVCGPHGFSFCTRCCVDYTFTDEGLSDNGDAIEDMYWELSAEARAQVDATFGPPPLRGSHALLGATSPDSMPTVDASALDLEDRPSLQKHRGTGRVFPTKFTPPSGNIRPTELFPGRATYVNITRYIHRSDPGKVLILTDGACLNNGQANPKAGWALVQGPGLAGRPQPATASGRLEKKGPWGDLSIQSSNRAELRAAIAALRFRDWIYEGFHTIVIATDSEYVTRGATEWAHKWMTNGWQTSGRVDVKNKDLWEMLLGEAERWHSEGLSIQFWRIPRTWNTDADAAAKRAAEAAEAPESWVDTTEMF
ncbi:ribonuclease H-like domain-containing protein [Xylaria intraflava]|nr:ribonuclease H-like domain-containing protein [Xylaria intraflava]